MRDLVEDLSEGHCGPVEDSCAVSAGAEKTARALPEPPVVLLQNDCIAHYRRSIYSLLCTSDRIRCTVVAARQSSVPFLNTLGSEDGGGIRHREAPVHEFRTLGRGPLTWQPEAVRFFWSHRPHCVIALGSVYSLTAWALVLLGRLRGIPVFLWGHGLLKPEKGPKWWVRKLFYRLAWGHLLYGDAAKSLLMKRGFPPQRLYVVYNSLSFDEQRAVAESLTPEHREEARRNLGIPASARVVIFTGRLEPVKRLDLLIDALARMRGNGREVHAILVGEGSQREDLQRAAQDRKVAGSVHFTGALYDEATLGRLYHASDLAVIPSGAGLTVIHALTYGVPVLIHDRLGEHFPEAEAVKDGITGFYYSYGNVVDLAAQIERALYPVPSRFALFSNCTAIVRERYNPHRQLDTILDAIRAAIAGGDRPCHRCPAE